MSASDPPKTKPAPNFFSTHSVILPVNLKTAYKVLGTAAGHDRVCRLSKVCTDVKLLEKDQVTLPVPDYSEGKRLGEVSVREVQSALAGSHPTGNDGSMSAKGGFKTLTRQHFVLEKVIPIIFGFFKKNVRIVGTLTWDDSVLSSVTIPSASSSEPVEALHESLSDPNGIMVWKLRTFEIVDGKADKTRVTERIEGWAPTFIRSIVQNAFTVEHRAQMELYHTLF